MIDLRIKNVLEKLSSSKFRSSFKLNIKELEYIEKKGFDAIKTHTQEFIKQRLSSANIPNDGKQTPMRGHPTFIAQHATATCCRNCLFKWHHIPKNVELTIEQQAYIVNLIMEWIRREMK